MCAFNSKKGRLSKKFIIKAFSAKASCIKLPVLAGLPGYVKVMKFGKRNGRIIVMEDICRMMIDLETLPKLKPKKLKKSPKRPYLINQI